MKRKAMEIVKGAVFFALVFGITLGLFSLYAAKIGAPGLW